MEEKITYLDDVSNAEMSDEQIASIAKVKLHLHCREMPWHEDCLIERIEKAAARHKPAVSFLAEEQAQGRDR